MDKENVTKCLSNLPKKLIDSLYDYGTIKKFTEGEYVIKQGQYAKFLPIVLNGIVKVSCYENELHFFLYFIRSNQTCILSFVHIKNQEPVKFSGIAEVNSEILLLPMENLDNWLVKYPDFYAYIIESYHRHYTSLLEGTKQIMCYSLDYRILNYLQEKSIRINSQIINITHQGIADDFATSREVVSRIIKKMEKSGHLQLFKKKIKVLK